MSEELDAAVDERIAALALEVREARARLDVVLANVPAIIWRWEPDRACTYVSEAWTELLGREPQEALGEGWANSVHPDDREAFDRACVRAMEEGVSFAAEYRLRKADGTFITVHDQGRPMLGERGLTGSVGAALDVSSQREAEVQTKATNALLSGAADGMGVGLGVKDLSGRYVLVNDVMSRSLGVASSEMIGRTDQEILGHGWEPLEAEDQRVLRTGEVERAERDVLLDGERRTYLTAKSPLRSMDGAVDGVIIVAADVTPERMRRERAERLERFARTLAGSHTAAEVVDAVLEDALDALEAPHGALGLPSSDGRSLTLQRQRGFEAKADHWSVLPLDEDSPPTRSFVQGRPLFYRSKQDAESAFEHMRGRFSTFEARAALPLLGGAGPMGVLYVAFDEPRTFDADAVAFFEAVAELIARALERATLADAAERSAQETHVLLEVAADLSRAVSVLDVQRIAVGRAREAVNADACLVGVVDRTVDRIVYADSGAYPPALVPLLPTSLEPGSSPAADAIVTGEAYGFATSGEVLSRYPGLAPLLNQLPYESRLFVPIVGSAEPSGVMVVSAGGPAAFGEDERGLLEAIARQCGLALERAALHRRAEEYAARAATLQSATQRLATVTSSADALDETMATAMTLVDAKLGGLALLDVERQALQAARWIGVPHEVVQRWATVSLEAPTVGAEVARTRDTAVLSVEELHQIDPALAEEAELLGIGSVLVVPLVSGDELVGILGLGLHPGAVIVPEDVDLVRAFAERGTLALMRGRLLEAEAKTRRELEAALSRLSRLQSVTTSLGSAMTIDEVGRSVLEETTAALGGSGGAVFLTEGGELRKVAVQGVAVGSPYDAAPTFAVEARTALSEAFRTGHVVWTPTAQEWRRRFPDGEAMFEGRARSTIAVPLVLEDRVLGAMSILFAQDRSLGKAERRLARTIGEQAGQAIERARLYETEIARGHRIQRLQGVSAELAAGADPAEVAGALVTSGVEAVGAQAGVVVLVSEDGDDVVIEAVSGFPKAMVEPFRVTPLNASLPGNDAVRSQVPSFLRTPEEIRRRYPHLDPSGPNLREGAWATLPLLAGGRAIGALHLSFAEPQAFDAEQIGGLSTIVNEAAQAMNRAQRFAREREVSEVLQENLLAKDVISAWRGAQVVTRYWAGAENLEVGGDWFDVIELPNGRLGVSVGDVVGRGLRAAAAMGQLRSALRAIALDGRGPSGTLEGLDRFARSTPGAELATVVYGELDPTSGSFTYACAGHPPPVASIDGRTEVLDGGRSPLLAAGYEGPRPAATRLLSPGSTVILYTDGLVERRGEPFDQAIARLVRALERAGDLEVQALSDSISDELVRGREPDDDVAILCLRVGQPRHVFSRTLEATPSRLAALRSAMTGWLEELEVPSEDTDALILAVNEAVANSIEHGYRSGGGEVAVRGTYGEGLVSVEITDRGSWRPGPGDPARGRGLSMMRALMDSVDIRQRETGTSVRLRRRLRLVEPTRAG